jgi:dsRNA-specific ribonuclease
MLSVNSSSPYNKTNVLINETHVKAILKRYRVDIEVKDISLYREALVDESYTESFYSESDIATWKEELRANKTGFNIVDLQTRTYQIKEFLGDIILKAIISEYIVTRYNDPVLHAEGFLTPLKSCLEDTAAFSKYARILGLGTFMMISRSIEENNGRDSEALLEDIFEAFMGALFLDQGWEITRKIMWNFLETEVDYASILSNNRDYMGRLQTFYHDNKWSHPTYETLNENKIHGKNYYTVCALTFDGKQIEETINTYTHKGKAKMESARLALIYFNQM